MLVLARERRLWQTVAAMRTTVIQLSRLVLVLVLSVAMTGLSFAHRAPGQVADPAWLAFVSAGGTPSDLCHSDTGDGAPAHERAGPQDCAACRLVDAVALPQPQGTPRGPVSVRPAEDWPEEAVVPLRANAHLLPQGRAPPQS
jgi:hypothetical protein